MSAYETLNEAARLMRKRAEAATPSADPEPGGWAGFVLGDGRSEMYAGPAEDGYRTGAVWSFAGEDDCDNCVAPSQDDIDHIASWHPSVALAVADLLDFAAGHWNSKPSLRDPALAVARAYLGITEAAAI